MDDLGDPYEVEVEHFICPKTGRNTILKSVTPLPSNYSNLLASTSRYNHAFVASPATISVYTLHDLRNPDASAEPCAIVNLASLGVAEIWHIILTLADTVLAVLAVSAQEPNTTKLVFLHVSALITGRAHTIPSPDTARIQAIAVSPAPSDETQPLFVCLSKTHAVVYRLGGQSPELMTKIPVQDAPCVAVSHDEKLIAASTTRGSVALFDPTSGELRGTIVEVESGWQPFQLHFAGADYLFTAYESGRSTYDVIWHLKYEQDSVHVSGKSPLGELCYPLMVDDEQQDIRPRAVMFAYVAEWHLAVVASSMSCDLDIVVQLENESWGVWKLPEGFIPSLPMNSDEEDTTAFGLALDFADTSPVPPREQGASSTSPMPGILVMSSDSVVIPFRLVDLRPGARCDAVREPDPIPPLPLSNAPAELGLPSLSASDSSAEGTASSQTLFTQPFELESASNAEDGDRHSQVDQSSHSLESKSENVPSQQVTESSSTMPQNSVTLRPTADLNLFSEKSFTGTKPFLSNFNFPAPPSSSRSSRSSNSVVIPEKVHIQDPFAVSHSVSMARPPLWNSTSVSTAGKVSQQNPVTVDLRPQLNEARAAIKEDATINPHDCIRSILKEMSEEFSVMRKSVEVMSTELEAMKKQVSVKTEHTTDTLNNFRRDIRNAYQVELEIRTLATQKLKEVIRLREGYESLKLGRDVVLDEGISKSLLAEYRAVDLQMSRKEAEIDRLIRGIEDKLHSHELERKKRRDPEHVLQTIYSTLSLQGLRIKRLLTLLNAIAQRVEEGNLDRRRSSLGLSIARLENLSLGLDASAAESRPFQLPHRQSNGANTTDSVSVPLGQGALPTEDDSEGKSDSISNIFRKLAMRDGRSRILAETSYREEAAGVNKAVVTSLHPVKKPSPNVSSSKTPSGMGEPTKKSDFLFSVDRPTTPTFTTQILQNTADNSNESVSLSSNSASSKPPISRTQSRRNPVLGRSQKSNQPTHELPRTTNPLSYFSASSRPKDATSFSDSDSDSISRPSAKRSASSLLVSEKSHLKPSQSSQTEEPSNTSSNADDASLPTIDITSPSRKNRTPWPPIQMKITQHPVTIRESASSHMNSSKSSQKVQFADLPPDDDVKKRSFSSASKPTEETTSTKDKNQPTSSKDKGLFAHLPPDDDDGSSVKRRSSNTNVPKVSVSNVQPKSDGLFAALPPDDTPLVGKPQPKFNPSEQKVPDSTNAVKMSSSPFASLTPTTNTTKNEALESSPLFPGESSGSKKNEDKSITPVKAMPVLSTPTENLVPNNLSSPQTSNVVAEGGKTAPESAAGDASTSAPKDTTTPNSSLFSSQLSLGEQSAPTFGNLNTSASSSIGTQRMPTPFGDVNNDGNVKNPFGGALFGMQSGFGSSAGGNMSFDATAVQGGNASNNDSAKQNMINVANDTSSDDSDKDVRLDQPQGFGSMTPSGGSSAFPFGGTGNTGTTPTNFGAPQDSSSPFGGFGGGNANTGASGFGGIGNNMGNAGIGAGGQPNLGFGSASPSQVTGSGLFGSVGTGLSGNSGGSGFGANAFGSSGGFNSPPAPTFGATSMLGSANVGGGFGGSNTFGSSPWPAASSSSFGVSSPFGGAGSGAGGNFGGSSAPFGMTSTFGATSSFGVASPIGGGGGFNGMSTNAGQSSFGGMNVNSSSFGAGGFSGNGFGGGGFGGGAGFGGGGFGGGAGFGGGGFGGSGFGGGGLEGTPQTNASPFGSFGAASAQSSGGNASPFAAHMSSPSGFASIASSGPGLTFGDGKPPAFTSPAFSERRA